MGDDDVREYEVHWTARGSFTVAAGSAEEAEGVGHDRASYTEMPDHLEVEVFEL